MLWFILKHMTWLSANATCESNSHLKLQKMQDFLFINTHWLPVYQQWDLNQNIVIHMVNIYIRIDVCCAGHCYGMALFLRTSKCGSSFNNGVFNVVGDNCCTAVLFCASNYHVFFSSITFMTILSCFISETNFANL